MTEVRRIDTAERAYLFSHTLVREAAESLLNQEEHARLCNLASSVLGIRNRSEITPEIASLLSLQRLTRKFGKQEANWLVQSAALEASRNNLAVSLERYARFAKLKGIEAGARIDSLIQSARLLERLGRGDDALDSARQAYDLASKAGEKRLAALARLTLGAILRRRGEHGEARKFLVESENLCRESRDLACQAESNAERGLIHEIAGERAAAEECFVSAERLFRRAGDLHGVCRMLGNLASLHDGAGDHEAALAALDEAEDLAQVLDDTRISAAICGNRANTLMELGRHDAARIYYEKAAQAFAACGDMLGRATCLSNYATLHEQEGRLDDAAEGFASVIAISAEIGAARLGAYALANLGVVRVAQGRYDEALEHYRRALNEARRLLDNTLEISVLTNLGMAQRVQNAPKKALPLFEEAIELARNSGTQADLGELFALQAQTLLDCGKETQAHKAALDTLDFLDQTHAEGGLAAFRCLMVLVAYEYERGNLREARLLARDARDLAHKLGFATKHRDADVQGSLKLLANLIPKTSPVPKATRI